MSPKVARPFNTECRGCGEMIAMFPYTDRNGCARWMPTNFEDGFPPERDEWDPQTMTSHFATCPEAEKFRRSREQ
ncbi:MAG: hypothetical protein ACE15D_18665 [Candidatus Eisenbacteria bacterium]